MEHNAVLVTLHKALPKDQKQREKGPVKGPSQQKEKILLMLKKQSLSSAEIAEKLNLDTKTGSLKRVLKELLLAELIAHTIPDKPQSRLQKYRIKS